MTRILTLALSLALAAGSTAAPSRLLSGDECYLLDSSYDCERPPQPLSLQPSSTLSRRAAPPDAPPPPIGKDHCVWDSSHWDCFDSHAQADAAAAAYATGQCLIRNGATHGNCSAADAQPECGAVLLQDYNMPLHIAAIFLVLFVSGLGVMLPTIAGWIVHGGDRQLAKLDAASFGREYGIWANLFFLARHFGTGVIIATAFIHLLYEGFMTWSDRCVGTLAFPPVAPAIAMAAAFVTFVFDYCGSRVMDSHTVVDSAEHSRDASKHENDVGIADPCHPDILAIESALKRRQVWEVVLLEMGIIFHSVMIGVTLGADPSSGFTTLLIVILFHQFFEGAALGARIALCYWLSRTRAFLQALAFMLITPIGIAIGMGVRTSFSANGKTALIAVGILDSTSAGILLYTAFKLLAADFVEGPLRTAPWTRAVPAFLAMMAGLALMSLMGKWI